MHPDHIAGMLKVLKPVLTNHPKAKTLLERYWRDQMAIVWSIKQVHTAANERELALNDAEARQILQKLLNEHDPQYGIDWQRLIETIEESAFYRKLTKAELKRFIERNIITKN